MSNSDIKSVSATTGQYPALTAANKPQGGSKPPEDGNSVPVERASEADLQKLAEKLNVASLSVGRDLRFEVDLNSRRAVIQVLDSETGEVIRQIPPEKAKFYLTEAGAMSLRLLDASV